MSLSDSTSPQVSRTLLSMLHDLNDSVVWMVSTQEDESFNLCTNPFVIVPSTPVTIGITVTFMFHCCWVFFTSLAMSRHLCFFSLFFQFYPVISRNGKVYIFFIFYFLFFCWLSLGLVVWPRFSDPFVSQNPLVVCATDFLWRILSYAYIICSYG